MQIKDRTFIVSGGASGLGLATTLQLISQGAYVSVIDLNPPPSDQISDEIKSKFIFTKTDVSSTESLQSALKATLSWISSSTSAPLSGVVCCAGIGKAAPALRRQPEDAATNPDKVQYYDMGLFDRMLAINLRGTVDLLRLAVPHMALNEPWGDDDERGVIIVVASIAAYEGQVGQLAYSASKGGVVSIVIPLARELGQKAGIRVMGIAPGLFQTGMTSVATPKPKSASQHGASSAKKERGGGSGGGGAAMAGFNQEMIQYPMRMGQGEEFAHLVKTIIENPMLNGSVIRLDGAVRMPSRL